MNASSESLPVAVITGAERGIGLATAEALATTHRVAMLGLDGKTLEEAAAGLGGTVRTYRCDITDQASVDSAIAAVADDFGGIDVAISNAGIGSAGMARHLSPDVLAKQLDVNVTGNWRFIHACLPHLEHSRGYVLGVASAAAIMAPPGEAFYGASKAGLEALLDTVRVEVKHLGIDVGVAYMVFVDTPLVRESDEEHPDVAVFRNSLRGAAGRTFPASDVATAFVRAIRHRRREVFIPPSLKVQHRLRGMIGPIVDRKFARLAPRIDELTQQKVSERGPYAAGFLRRTISADEEGR